MDEGGNNPRPESGAGPRAGWLGLGPDVRVWRSRGVDYAMLVIGALMLAANAVAATSGNAPGELGSWAGSQAVVGFGLALLAASDLLVDRGAGRAAVALRAVAMLCLPGVLAAWAWAWAAAHGSGLAALALAFGAACAALALSLAWARR